MPFIDTIVLHINECLKGCSFTDGKFHGIATVIARKKTATAPLETLPGILEGKAYQTVEPNDKYGLILYHKVISNVYGFERGNSFGDNYNLKCTTEMQMVVWADSIKQNKTAELLEPVIVFGIPFGLTPELKNTLKLIKCVITPLGSAMDRLQVFRLEYPQSEFFLKPEHHFFSIRYRIETTFDRNCVNTCLCGE